MKEKKRRNPVGSSKGSPSGNSSKLEKGTKVVIAKFSSLMQKFIKDEIAAAAMVELAAGITLEKKYPANSLAGNAKYNKAMKPHEIYFNWITTDFNERQATACLAKLSADSGESAGVAAPRTSSTQPYDYTAYKCSHMTYDELCVHLLDDITKHLLRQFELTFLNCYFGDYATAKSRLLDLRRYFEQIRNTKNGLLEGFNYMFNAIQSFMHSMHKEKLEFQTTFAKLPVLPDLTPAGRAFVMKMKFYSLCSPRYYSTQKMIVDEMVLLEPEVSHWHFWSYRCHRDLRKHPLPDWEGVIRHNKPETSAILRALDMEPQNSKYKFYYILNLAELSTRRSYPFKYGSILFQSIGNVMTHVMMITRVLLQLPDESTEGILFQDLHEIYSSVLTCYHYNLELAGQCIERAVHLLPYDDHVNYLMGMFQINKPDRDLNAAERYLRTATQQGIANFSARLDLIYVLMSNAVENEAKIISVFDDIFAKSVCWSENQKLKMIFLKGFFYHIVKPGDDSAVRLWLEACRLDNVSYFKDIQLIIEKFCWLNGEAYLKGVKDTLSMYKLTPNLPREDASILKRILKEATNLRYCSIHDSDENIDAAGLD